MLNRHQMAAVASLLDRVESLLAEQPLDAATADRLRGELASRRSTQHFFAGEGTQCLLAAQEALRNVPPEWQHLRAQRACVYRRRLSTGG